MHERAAILPAPHAPNPSYPSLGYVDPQRRIPSFLYSGRVFEDIGNYAICDFFPDKSKRHMQISQTWIFTSHFVFEVVLRDQVWSANNPANQTPPANYKNAILGSGLFLICSYTRDFLDACAAILALGSRLCGGRV